MRGVGGPLLCIGDLLSDVGEEDTATSPIIHGSNTNPNSSEASAFSDHHLQPSDVTKLYQENYKCLSEALGGTGHSWTALTLELCSALETANKLVQSTNSHVIVLSEKIRELERIAKKGDAVIRMAEFMDGSTSHKGSSNSRTTQDKL